MVKKHLVALVSALTVAASAQATVVLYDEFSYPDGALTNVSGGKWVRHSGNGSGLQVANNQVRLSQALSDDVNSTLAGQPYDTNNGVMLYASFTVNFTGLPSGAGGYFAHFKDSGTAFRCRVFATTNEAAPGTYRLGVANGTDPPAVYPADLNLNSSYLVVCRLIVDSAISDLWINPANEFDFCVTASDPIPPAPITAFALRQSLFSGSGMGNLNLDNVVVGTTFSDVLGWPRPVWRIDANPMIAGVQNCWRVRPSGVNVPCISDTADWAVTVQLEGFPTNREGRYAQFVMKFDPDRLTPRGGCGTGRFSSNANFCWPSSGQLGADELMVFVSTTGMCSGAAWPATVPVATVYFSVNTSSGLFGPTDLVIDDSRACGGGVGSCWAPSTCFWTNGVSDCFNFSTFLNDVSQARAQIITHPSVTGTCDIAPTIASQPQDQAVGLGTTACFTVIATGTSPLSYRWRSNGVNMANGGRISGVTTSNLCITGTRSTDAASYSCVITNLAGSVTSRAALLQVVNPPAFLSLPTSVILPYYTQAVFTVSVTPPDAAVRWFRNGLAIPGATNLSLMLSNVERGDAALYSVIASNAAGTTSSAPFEVQVNLAQHLGVIQGLYATAIQNDSGPCGPPGGPLPHDAASATPFPCYHGLPIFFTMLGGTNEPGRTHCGIASTNVKWLNYFARRPGPLPVSTEGSDFDTVLAVYKTVAGELVLEACNRDCGTNKTSCLEFNAEVRVYSIAVGVEQGPAGTVRLQVGKDTVINPRFHRLTSTLTNTFTFDVFMRPDIPVKIWTTDRPRSNLSNEWQSLGSISTNRDAIRRYRWPNASNSTSRFFTGKE